MTQVGDGDAFVRVENLVAVGVGLAVTKEVKTMMARGMVGFLKS